MRFPWKSAALLAIALTVLSALSAPVSATHTGTVQPAGTTVSDNNLVLDVDHYQGYTFNLLSGDSIVYGIQVITPAASDIDVYFFTSAGLAAYRADPPQTSQALQSQTNNQFAGTFSAATGAITVIIDNVNGTGATPTGQVTVQVGMTRNGTGPTPDFFSGMLALGIALCVGAIAVVVIVIFLIVYLVTRGNRPPPMPPPPYAPPQQPWYPPQPPQQPPQGGMPPEQYPPQGP